MATTSRPRTMKASGREESSKEEGSKSALLSPELREFYRLHNAEDVEDVLSEDEKTVRFVRLNPRFDKEDSLALLQSELPSSPDLKPIPWLDESLGFYAVAGDINLAQSRSFRSGRVYGMDVSSGAAVAALLSDKYDCQGDSSLSVGVSQITRSSDPAVGGCAAADIRSSFHVDGDKVSEKSKTSGCFRVLDLCCSPGMKTCAIADLLSAEETEATVVGVDISESRLSLCKNIVKKYHVDPDTSGRPTGSIKQSKETTVARESPSNVRIRLYCGDGVTFGTRPQHKLVFDSQVAADDCQNAGKRKRMNKSARARERKRLRLLEHVDRARPPLPDLVGGNGDGLSQRCGEGDTESSVYMQLFDRVLVDAECSTDGSLKHVKKMLLNTPKSADGNVSKDDSVMSDENSLLTNSQLTDVSQLEKLVSLQRDLINSGFRLLKPGGTMVYSTCSLSEAQNEKVVSYLLESYPNDAELVPVSFSSSSLDKSHKEMVSEGYLAGTVRFLPGFARLASFDNPDSAFYGGGFFLAKVRKKVRVHR